MTSANARASSRTKTRTRSQVVSFGRDRNDALDEVINGEPDVNDPIVLGRDALDVASSWAVIGLFTIVFFALVHYMALILIPVTLAIVVGLILGLLADKLGRAGMPRFAIAITLSSLVFLVLFALANALVEPVSSLVREGPNFIERTIERFTPMIESQHWLNLSPAALQNGPLSMEKLLENSTSILGVVTASLTPAIVQGLIFFAALLLFLYGRLRLRRTLILAFPRRRQRLMTIRVLNSIDEVLGYYFATASVLYLGLGIVMTAIAWACGLSMPLLWGVFAFLSSFIPFLGITLMTIAVAIAGVLTHDAIFLALLPAFLFFTVHLVMENLIFPAVMGRQWEINPFVVFIAILFWTWMWGAVGAMLALPLSLILMTVLAELFPEKKTVPQLPG